MQIGNSGRVAPELLHRRYFFEACSGAHPHLYSILSQPNSLGGNIRPSFYFEKVCRLSEAVCRFGGRSRCQRSTPDEFSDQTCTTSLQISASSQRIDQEHSFRPSGSSAHSRSNAPHPVPRRRSEHFEER